MTLFNIEKKIRYLSNLTKETVDRKQFINVMEIGDILISFGISKHHPGSNYLKLM